VGGYGTADAGGDGLVRGSFFLSSPPHPAYGQHLRLPAYVHTLHAELAPKGVYAGTLLIGALIEGSEAHRNASAWAATGTSRWSRPRTSPSATGTCT
jgi:hypothetical protein